MMKASPPYEHLSALTDHNGVFEHALLDAPRREHGSCVDDVARALIVVTREAQQTVELRKMAAIYLRFLESAVREDGLVHNRMGADGAWSDDPAMGDWWGRLLWALGTIAGQHGDPWTRARAVRTFRIAARERSTSLRTLAFATLGAAAIVRVRGDDHIARTLLREYIAAMPALPDGAWQWPEPRLAYGNASLAEALIAAGNALDDADATAQGLRMLEFLLSVETSDERFSVTGTAGRGPGEKGPSFDQQPLELAALADACATAYAVTGDPAWLPPIARAWSWFTGLNDSGTVMFDDRTGAGFDGLERDGRNENRGAESTLAALSTYQQARRHRALTAPSPARIHTAQLTAQPDRVITQLFLPGEEWAGDHSRAGEIIARVMAMPADQTETLAAGLVRDFGARHPDVRALFLENAAVVNSRLVEPVDISVARRLVIGASFTAEYAVEGAALCNPSAVEHPDQAGLAPGERRVALALRPIGEGHRSSIEFAEAIIGPGRHWRFVERMLPLSRARIDEGDWSISHFRVAIEEEGIVNEISHSVLQGLPERFTASDVEASVAGLPTALARRADSARHIEALRELTNSVYRAEFSPETALSQRVLTPVAAEERNGMEDARFVRFTDLAGTTHYRGTYTAYDGRDIAPRLIVTSDLRTFDIHRLTGDAAQDKGMALFPRPVGGRYLALSRTGGEDISLAESSDGVIWSRAGTIHAPAEAWEIVHTGNCGPPLETPHGWIVLVHGVGPMRTYSLGALLLDLDDPTIVLGRTSTPILQPVGDRRDGYVPNVVYSCGGLIVDDVIWVPIGIGDARIGVCSIEVDELLAHLVP